MIDEMKNMSTWTIINGKLDFNPPHDIDIVEACQIESPCKTRCAIFYTLKPYGCLSQPDLSKILERILHRYTDLVQISRSLIESVWGSYIFWLLEKKTGTSVLLCDPMQSVRLFYRIGDGVTLIDTAIEKIVPRPIEWNSNYLASACITQFGSLGETPFSNVKVVPPGHLLEVTKKGLIRTIRVWPMINKNSPCEPVDHTATAIASVVDRIASNHNLMTLSLSGGVDSTALALILRGVVGEKMPITGIHLYSPGSPDQDERKFANIAADTAKISLLNICMDTHLPFSKLTLTHKPQIISPNFIFQSINDEIIEILGHQGVIINGQAGDLLFSSAPSSLVVADALLNEGIREAWRVIRDLASLFNASIPRVCLSAIKSLAGHPSQAQSLFQKQLHELGLISSDFIDCAFKKDNTEITVDRYRHYPATQEMVADLEKMISIQPCFSDCAFPRTLSPLLTLPVVEAALATPIYKHFDGNIDRTILRHAAGKFGDCEPLWRRSKGAFDSTLIKGLMKNRTNIESFLLDGVLVQQKILQKSGIDNAFRRIIAGDVSADISLALPLCVEMFCNAWKD
ncbi:TPA: asparagine synthase-related protein [Klebsiella pneumoniae]